MENIKIAENAIALLKRGISVSDKSMMLEAYEMVKVDSFSWDGSEMDVLFNEWDKLVDEANDILLEY